MLINFLVRSNEPITSLLVDVIAETCVYSYVNKKNELTSLGNLWFVIDTQTKISSTQIEGEIHLDPDI